MSTNFSEEASRAAEEQAPNSETSNEELENREELEENEEKLRQQQVQRNPSNFFDLVFGLAKLGVYDIPKGIGTFAASFPNRIQQKKIDQYASHQAKLNKSVNEFKKEHTAFLNNKAFKEYNTAINAMMTSVDSSITDPVLRKKAAIKKYEDLLSETGGLDNYIKNKDAYNKQIDKIDVCRKEVETNLLATASYTEGLKDNDVFLNMHKDNPQALEKHLSDLDSMVSSYENDVLKPSMELTSTSKLEREQELEETKKKLLDSIKETIEKIRENLIAIINSIKSVFGR